MTAFLVILAALVLLALLPVGAHVRYDGGGPRCELVIGFVKIQLYPKKKKMPILRTRRKQKPQEAKEQEQKSVGSIALDFYEFLKICLDFLDRFHHKLRVKILTLHVGFGGKNDPASAAIHYGQAWAAIGVILPLLRRRLHVKKENISASCDFTRGELQFFAELKATLLLADLAAIAVRSGLKLIRHNIPSKNQTKQNKNLSEKAVQNNESSST